MGLIRERGAYWKETTLLGWDLFEEEGLIGREYFWVGLIRGGRIGRKHFLVEAYLRERGLLDGNTFLVGLIRGRGTYWKSKLEDENEKWD